MICYHDTESWHENRKTQAESARKLQGGGGAVPESISHNERRRQGKTRNGERRGKNQIGSTSLLVKADLTC